MCNVVKETYGNEQGGFLAGQVFRYAGFISEQGSVGEVPGGAEDKAKIKPGEVAIVTYWSSFDQHEKSHADAAFREKFDALVEFCDETFELGYEMLWQGVPE